MYIPEIYQFENPSEIRDFVAANGFAILVNQTDGQLWATHIPLLLDVNADGNEILHGHVSKENLQWNSFASEQQVLAIFSGPHSYISSSWYTDEEVPTWNYTAVHIYGTVKIIEGEAVIISLKKLVDKYEAASENPVRIEALSRKTMLQARGIVAFEIEIETIQAVRKMSQGRDENDYKTIISELEKTGKPDSIQVAKEMKCARGY